jgi:hypothetical protein
MKEDKKYQNSPSSLFFPHPASRILHPFSRYVLHLDFHNCFGYGPCCLFLTGENRDETPHVIDRRLGRRHRWFSGGPIGIRHYPFGENTRSNSGIEPDGTDHHLSTTAC